MRKEKTIPELVDDGMCILTKKQFLKSSVIASSLAMFHRIQVLEKRLKKLEKHLQNCGKN